MLLAELSFRYAFYLVWDIRVADIPFAWLVYIHTYCVPIATLNQNKWSRLLYLENMHIIIKVLACGLVFSHLQDWLFFLQHNNIPEIFFKSLWLSTCKFQACPSPPINIPPSICHLVGPGGGEFLGTSLSRGGAFVKSSRSC